MKQNAMQDRPKISGITLGTVQLGLDYGIANRQGRPDDEQAKGVLDAARKVGINTLDTAASYGKAEALIGSYLGDNGRDSFPWIVTKFRIPDGVDSSPAAMRASMHASARASIMAMGIDRIPVFLFHQAVGQAMERLAEPMGEILQELRSEGLIDHGGLSAYEPTEVEPILGYEAFRYVQVPVNILDQRLIRNGALLRMKDNEKVVFARSIFLQGLFFLDPSELQGRLREASTFLRDLQEIALSEEMGIAQLALSFVRDLEGVTSLVLGAENPEQVLANAEMWQGPRLRDSARRKAAERFAEVPEHILNPALWKA